MASEDNTQLSEAEVTLNGFWPSVTDDVKRIKSVDAKNQVLPLARIKKIMKLDEDVKMISAEAPLLFSKAAEIFIHELTLRAWIHTENNKRRTLQRNDIAMAITKYDQFDFLIDIVPREPELPKKPKESPPAQKPNGEPVQYYLQLPQQQQALAGPSLAGISTTPTITMSTPTNSINAGAMNAIQIPTNQLPLAALNPNGTQNILVTNTGQPLTTVGGAVLNNLGECVRRLCEVELALLIVQQIKRRLFLHNLLAIVFALLGGIQAHAQHTQGPIQLVQQIVTPNGEIQHMPV